MSILTQPSIEQITNHIPYAFMLAVIGMVFTCILQEPNQIFGWFHKAIVSWKRKGLKSKSEDPFDRANRSSLRRLARGARSPDTNDGW